MLGVREWVASPEQLQTMLENAWWRMVAEALGIPTTGVSGGGCRGVGVVEPELEAFRER